jgi:translation initiation factor 1
MSASNFVYSTQHGKLCPDCGRPQQGCVCVRAREAQALADAARSDGVVRVARETKGRKGAGVTLVTGLGLVGKDLKALATELKKKCGTGGTIKDGVIEIQGEQRDKLVALLEKKGYTVKRVGG